MRRGGALRPSRPCPRPSHSPPRCGLTLPCDSPWGSVASLHSPLPLTFSILPPYLSPPQSLLFLFSRTYLPRLSLPRPFPPALFSLPRHLGSSPWWEAAGGPLILGVHEPPRGAGYRSLAQGRCSHSLINHCFLCLPGLSGCQLCAQSKNITDRDSEAERS